MTKPPPAKKRAAPVYVCSTGPKKESLFSRVPRLTTLPLPAPAFDAGKAFAGAVQNAPAGRVDCWQTCIGYFVSIVWGKSGKDTKSRKAHKLKSATIDETPEIID